MAKLLRAKAKTVIISSRKKREMQNTVRIERWSKILGVLQRSHGVCVWWE